LFEFLIVGERKREKEKGESQRSEREIQDLMLVDKDRSSAFFV